MEPQWLCLSNIFPLHSHFYVSACFGLDAWAKVVWPLIVCICMHVCICLCVAALHLLVASVCICVCCFCAKSRHPHVQLPQVIFSLFHILWQPQKIIEHNYMFAVASTFFCFFPFCFWLSDFLLHLEFVLVLSRSYKLQGSCRLRFCLLKFHVEIRCCCCCCRIKKYISSNCIVSLSCLKTTVLYNRFVSLCFKGEHKERGNQTPWGRTCFFSNNSKKALWQSKAPFLECN